MTLTRRTMLGGLVAGAGALALPRVARASASVRPRKFIQIFLRGGIDSILTTDPKTAKEVDANIDLPYVPGDIVQLDRHRLGPLFAGIQPNAHRIALLNGVNSGSVGHGSGAHRTLQMKEHFVIRDGVATSLASAVGEMLPGSSLLVETWMLSAGIGRPECVPTRRALTLDGWSENRPTLIDRMWACANESSAFSSVQRALADDVSRCRTSRPALECDPIEETRRLLDKLVGLPVPPPVTALQLTTSDTNAAAVASVKRAGYEWAAMTRDLVYSLRHDLTSSTYFKAPHPFWDSHGDNLVHQTRCNEVFVPGFSHLLAELEIATTSDGVSLADQTGILICSELGRFPVLNSAKGKDHFPQHPFIFVGPGLRAGQYGATDRRMIARPVVEATGLPGASGGRIPQVEDVAATVFQWFGLEPTRAGYRGRPLPFLLA